MEIRSFLAFELPVDIKERISRISESFRKSLLDVKWVRVDNIHLTVIFLGNIEEEKLEDIEYEVSQVCTGYGPFDVSLKSVGCFPNLRKPRVLWVGLDGNFRKMTSFRDDLQKGLRHFGIKREKRPFKPHLTLGRFKKSRGNVFSLEEYLLEYENLASPPFTLDELILFKSDLKPGGAVYTKLKTWPLSG